MSHVAVLGMNHKSLF